LDTDARLEDLAQSADKVGVDSAASVVQADADAATPPSSLMPEEEEEEEDTAAAAEEEGKDVRTNMNAGAEQGAVHEPGQKDGAKDGTKDTEGLLTQKAEKDGEAREREGRAAELLVEDTAEADVLEAEGAKVEMGETVVELGEGDKDREGLLIPMEEFGSEVGGELKGEQEATKAEAPPALLPKPSRAKASPVTRQATDTVVSAPRERRAGGGAVSASGGRGAGAGGSTTSSKEAEAEVVEVEVAVQSTDEERTASVLGAEGLLEGSDGTEGADGGGDMLTLRPKPNRPR